MNPTCPNIASYQLRNRARDYFEYKLFIFCNMAKFHTRKARNICVKVIFMACFMSDVE